MSAYTHPPRILGADVRARARLTPRTRTQAARRVGHPRHPLAFISLLAKSRGRVCARALNVWSERWTTTATSQQEKLADYR